MKAEENWMTIPAKHWRQPTGTIIVLFNGTKVSANAKAEARSKTSTEYTSRSKSQKQKQKQSRKQNNCKCWRLIIKQQYKGYNDKISLIIQLMLRKVPMTSLLKIDKNNNAKYACWNPYNLYIGYLHLTKNLTMKLLYLSWLLKSSRTQQNTNQPDCERPDGTSMPQQSSETEYLGHWINQMKAVTKKKEVIQIWNS